MRISVLMSTSQVDDNMGQKPPLHVRLIYSGHLIPRAIIRDVKNRKSGAEKMQQWFHMVKSGIIRKSKCLRSCWYASYLDWSPVGWGVVETS